MSSSDEATIASPRSGTLSPVTSSIATSSVQTAAVERKPSVLSVSSGTMQYLNPDSAPPLTVSLDSNNSPLAMLARTCNNIGKNMPVTLSSSSRSAQLNHRATAVGQHQQSHQTPSFHRNPETANSTSPSSENGKKSSALVADHMTDRMSRVGGCTDSVSSRKESTAGVATVVGSRSQVGVGSAGSTATPGSASGSPVSTSSSPLACFSAKHRDAEGVNWNVGHHRPRSTASRSTGFARRVSGNGTTNAVPVRPVPVIDATTGGLRGIRSRQSIGGYENGGIFDLFRYCNGAIKSQLETKTASIGDAEDDDCNVDDAAEGDQDQPEDCRSIDMVEQMMQRYAADVEAEIQRRSSVQRLLQHNREAVAFQTALATAAAATYHSSLLGQLNGHRGHSFMECGSGQSLLPPGADPSLYSAFVAATSHRFRLQQQQDEANRACDVSGNGSPTSSFCSPVNVKDSSALSNDDEMEDEPSKPTNGLDDDHHRAHNNHYTKQAPNRRHKFHHHFRNGSSNDEAFQAQTSGASGTQFSGLFFQAAVAAAAAAANGFPRSMLADRVESTSGSPLACNWLTTSGQFCGRRFASSDDLFHHLQSHVLQMSSSPLGDASTADHQQARNGHQLAAALTASLLQSPLNQYHTAMESAAAATPSALSATSGILPSVYPMLFGGRNPPIPPIMAAALTSSIQSAALGRRNAQHQFHGGDATGNDSSPPLSGSSVLMNAAASATRYHPYGKSSSLAVPQAGSGQPHHHHHHHQRHSPNTTGAGLVVPSLGAYLSASPFASSAYRSQRLLGPVAGP